jgi:hypothetical protein
MDSGFPHGRDSWISAAGTSWAVLAMTEALPPGTTTEKPKDASPVTAEKIDFAKQRLEATSAHLAGSVISLRRVH